MKISFNRGPFRIGMKTWSYGVWFILPFRKRVHVIGKDPNVRRRSEGQDRSR
jgi:hypothetical protein